MLFLALYSAVLAILCAAWYWVSVRHNRRKAEQVLGWLESALAGQGHVIGLRWINTSRFKIPLRLTSGVFHRAWIMVELSPCEMPASWIWSKLMHRQDLATFQADLDWPPSFSLDVHKFRWFARSSRKASSAHCRWTFEQTGPFIITTRMDWQKEIASAMTSLAGAGNYEFLNISFRRRSPHFSVTMPLETISPTCPARACMFDAVREVATSALPSVF